MKAFGNILFLVVLLALGYAIYPSLSEHLGWDKSTSTSSSEDIVDSSEDDRQSTQTDPAPSTGSPSARPASPDAQTSTASDTTALEQRFPYPDIQSLEAITNNWTAVPERALPEQITLKSDLQFQLGTTGSVTKSAGSTVYTKGTTGNQQVRVAMAPGSENETLVAMTDTDFKERVTEMYDTGVAKIRARIDAQRESERLRIAAASTITEAEKAQVSSPSSTSTDEVEIMKASISRGELAGLSAGDILTYRKLGFEKEGQTVFQVGAAVYEEKTLFGTFQTEAKAFIRDGKVIRWERAEN